MRRLIAVILTVFLALFTSTSAQAFIDSIPAGPETSSEARFIDSIPAGPETSSEAR